MTAPDASRGAFRSAARDALRRRLRGARAALDTVAHEAAADAVARRLTPLLEAYAPARVAGYLAVGGELDPGAALRACRAGGATTLLPVLDGDSLAFLPFDDATPMRANRFGIDEPVAAGSPPVAPPDIDVVLVPLVGFDEALNRLGMGGGFYDRSFAARRAHGAPPLLVGLAHELQRADTVFPDWWDVPLDVVVTETGVRRRARGGTARSGPA